MAINGNCTRRIKTHKLSCTYPSCSCKFANKSGLTQHLKFHDIPELDNNSASTCFQRTNSPPDDTFTLQVDINDTQDLHFEAPASNDRMDEDSIYSEGPKLAQPDLPVRSKNTRPIPSPNQIPSAPSKDYHLNLNGNTISFPHVDYSDQHLGVPCDSQGNNLPPGTPPPPRSTARSDDWTAFNGHLEFETAEFLFKKTQMSQPEINVLMDLWATTLLRHNDNPPFCTLHSPTGSYGLRTECGLHTDSIWSCSKDRHAIISVRLCMESMWSLYEVYCLLLEYQNKFQNKMKQFVK
jgi:hypothetical protein